MTILVTGGTGLVGPRLLGRLTAAGVECRALVRPGGARETVEHTSRRDRESGRADRGDVRTSNHSRPDSLRRRHAVLSHADLTSSTAEATGLPALAEYVDAVASPELRRPP